MGISGIYIYTYISYHIISYYEYIYIYICIHNIDISKIVGIYLGKPKDGTFPYYSHSTTRIPNSMGRECGVHQTKKTIAFRCESNPINCFFMNMWKNHGGQNFHYQKAVLEGLFKRIFNKRNAFPNPPWAHAFVGGLSFCRTFESYKNQEDFCREHVFLVMQNSDLKSPHLVGDMLFN